MTKYVLGVDGGGTKTHCALFDLNGNKLDLLDFGTTNHERLPGGFDELKIKLQEMIDEIITKHHVLREDISKSVFGLAGLDTKQQHMAIESILKDIGIIDFTLCNDAFLGVKAGNPKGHGICAINGTGCTVCGIDDSDHMLQIGGQGHYTGEIGGGSFLGTQAIQTVYNYLFRNGKSTLLTDILFDKFQVHSKYEFIDKIREKINCKETSLSQLAPIVFTATNQGDEPALKILEIMGKNIGVSINGMIKELNFHKEQTLDIVLAGSIHVKGENPTSVEALKNEVLRHNRDRSIRLTLLKKPPVSGAVIWALQEAKQDNTLFNKVMKQL